MNFEVRQEGVAMITSVVVSGSWDKLETRLKDALGIEQIPDNFRQRSHGIHIALKVVKKIEDDGALRAKLKRSRSNVEKFSQNLYELCEQVASQKS